VTVAPPASPAFPRAAVAEIGAGLAAAAVVLPQAMAFGVALFSVLGLSAAQGAVAGLIGAICLCLVSGLSGATAGLISAPTGPSLALLGGAMAALGAAGTPAALLFPGLVAVTVTAGLAQVVLAVAGGARLVRFIPYPVIAGFMIGSALLMLRSQAGPLGGAAAEPAALSWRWIPAVTAALTLLAQFLASRYLPRVPGTLLGLAAGIAGFQLLCRMGPGFVPGAWVIGALPDISALRFAVDFDTMQLLPWPQVLTSGLALGLMASLNVLLTAVIADAETGQRHDSRRELLAQGAGQILVGALGGMAGSATTGATVVATKTGGRRWAAAATAIVLVLLLFLGFAGRAVPISALAGIIIGVAAGLIDLDVLAWARRRRTRQDAGIALVVAATTVQYGLVTAIGIGVVIAIILFVATQVREPVVHRRSTAREQRSMRQRLAAERAALDAQGGRIVLYELRGNLFFAKADQLFEELMPDLDRPAWVILDLHRVGQVDLSGRKILQQAAKRIARNGGELVFCEVHSSLGLGGEGMQGTRIRSFNGTDEALEYAEDALLVALGIAPASPTQRVALADSDLCRGMTAAQVAALDKVLKQRRVPAGESLFVRGQAGSELYLVVQGEIEIRLAFTRHHYKRLAIYGPGTLFGEVAFLDPGPRTADAYAVRTSELRVLDRDALAQLTREVPDAAVNLLLGLGKAQGHSLRWSAAEIQSLAQR
jgi:SulP family sulfate permease